MADLINPRGVARAMETSSSINGKRNPGIKPYQGWEVGEKCRSIYGTEHLQTPLLSIYKSPVPSCE